MELLDQLKYDEHGLIPAVIQDAENGGVLMMGWMDRTAVERTLSGGKVCFWSRSRKKYWVKGETSGNFLLVREVLVNCYADSLLIKADPAGPTCHDGYDSCYYRKIAEDGSLDVVAERRFDPKEVYKK